MHASSGLTWLGVAVGLAIAYEMARNLADVRRYVRLRRM
ncbi:DUF6893 family small protein [Streptomyces sp. NPDC058417]